MDKRSRAATEQIQSQELVLAVFTESDGTFEIFRKIQTPAWVANSVYFMDHDSEGRCYCKWLSPSPPISDWPSLLKLN